MSDPDIRIELTKPSNTFLPNTYGVSATLSASYVRTCRWLLEVVHILPINGRLGMLLDTKQFYSI